MVLLRWRPTLRTDLHKLRIAQQYLEDQHSGHTVDALLLVVATECKDREGTKADDRVRYVRDAIAELRMSIGAPGPRGRVMVEPIYRDRPTAHSEHLNVDPCPQCFRRSMAAAT